MWCRGFRDNYRTTATRLVHCMVCCFAGIHGVCPRTDGQAELTWIAGHIPRWFTRLQMASWPPIQLLTGPYTELLCWSRPTHYNQATPHCQFVVWLQQGGHSPGEPGKVKEFKSGQGKVRESVFLHMVNYRECWSWHKMCKKGIIIYLLGTVVHHIKSERRNGLQSCYKNVMK